MPAPQSIPILLTPGPTAVPDSVLQQIAEPIIHHRTTEFRQLFAEVCQRLQRLFATDGPVLTIAGSGTTSFEAAQVSFIGKADGQHARGKTGKVLSIASGKFGERWQDIYQVYGVEQVRINVPWGQAVDPEQVEQALKDHPDVGTVALVHSETSTATACDLKTIGQIVRRSSDALLLVDGITSVGALPLEMDDWGIDILITGSQKALMSPPGLGFVGLGQRAVRRLEQTESVGSYCLDLRRWLKSWGSGEMPFTPPVNLIRGLRVALEMIEDEGRENVWTRTASLAQSTRAALSAMGLELVSTSPSDAVTGTFYPTGIEDAAFRNALLEKHGIQIAGGQDGRGATWKGKIFRISHMGHVNAQDTRAVLRAIEAELIGFGHRVNPATP